MRSSILMGMIWICTTAVASAQHCRKVDIDKSTGFCTVPDSALSPGEMDASLACVSNRDRPRSVTDSEKNAILAAYGYPADTEDGRNSFPSIKALRVE